MIQAADMRGEARISFKGAHFPPAMILTCGRWYVASPLRYRHVEALMEERGVPIDHATIQRGLVQYGSQLAEACHRRKRPVGHSWRRDETSSRVNGEWRYWSRAVDTSGQTIAFLLPEHRATEAALRFLTQAVRRHGVPETITSDGSEATEAAIQRDDEVHGTHIVIRQVKYLKNSIEQDQRASKRMTPPMVGFKAFDTAQSTLVGIELMHLLKKRQRVAEEGNENLTVAALFYSLAA